MRADLFHHQPRLTVLVLFLIVVGGLGAFVTMPRLEDPKMTPRWAFVLTRFPGASAERVESLVTEPIESRLRTLWQIRELRSSSRAGISVIQVELEDAISEVAPVWSRVRDELSEVERTLPEGVLEPQLEDKEVETYTYLAAIVPSEDGPAPRALLRRLSEELENRLEAVPGTVHVNVMGDVPEEVQVIVAPQTLASLGLSAQALSRRIAASDPKLAAGVVRGERSDYVLEVGGAFERVSRLRSLPVAVDQDGRTVRLGEIASITKGTVDPPSDLALVGGREAVVVGSRMAADRRVDLWARSVREELAAFERVLPRGLELRTIFDQSRYTRQRLDELGRNLLQGALFVVLVMFVMMGWRAALLVGSSLPLASLMVLAAMRLMGIPMHQMSVTGLIIALGLLIDNAIVMVDEVRHRLRSGLEPSAAIRRAVRHLAVPLFGSTLTTALAFMPLMLMPGPAGEFVGALGTTVVLAIASSFLLALSVTPALAGWLDRHAPRHRWLRALDEGLNFGALTRLWHGTQRSLLRHPILGCAVALVIPFFGIARMGDLEEQFFPPADRDQIQVQVLLPAQASLAETRRAAERARQVLLDHGRVRSVSWFVGRGAPLFYYNIVGGKDDAPNFAQALVQLDSPQGALALTRDLQRRLEEALPEARVLALALEQGPPFDAPVEFRIKGPALPELQELGEQVQAVLAESPGVIQTRTSLEAGRPELRFVPDPEALRLAGLDEVALARELQARTEGVLGGSLLEATEELPVRVRLESAARDDVEVLPSLEIPTPDGGWVPLASLGELELRPRWSTIPRRDGERINTVQAFIPAGELPSRVLARAQERIAAAGIGRAGYEIRIGGESEERDDAVANLLSAVGVLIVAMVGTLVLSFNSFRLCGQILLVAGASSGLALAALWIFGMPFGFMAIVGTMGLVGVAVNDSIVVLAGIRQDPDARAGERDAIARVVVRSTRHVLATTVTTIAGFLPLLLDGGLFWPPLAIAICGGLVGATLLALSFMPCFYALLYRHRGKEAQGGEVPAAAPAPPLATA